MSHPRSLRARGRRAVADKADSGVKPIEEFRLAHPDLVNDEYL